MIRCAPVRHCGELYMSDPLPERCQPIAQITFDKLDVKTIKHQRNILSTHFIHDFNRLSGTVQKISGCRMRAERLNQDRLSHP